MVVEEGGRGGGGAAAPRLGGEALGDDCAAGGERVAQEVGTGALELALGHRGETVGQRPAVDDRAAVGHQVEARDGHRLSIGQPVPKVIRRSKAIRASARA